MSQTVGFKDGKGRPRYKVAGTPDSASFATLAEAEAAGRKHLIAKPDADRPSQPRAAAPTPPGIKFTQAQVDSAAMTARAKERQRFRTVFASEHSRGRERLCATLLAASDGWPASQIVNRLPNMSTDAQFERELSEPSRAKADAVWDRANAAVATRREAAS